MNPLHIEALRNLVRGCEISSNCKGGIFLSSFAYITCQYSVYISNLTNMSRACPQCMTCGLCSACMKIAVSRCNDFIFKLELDVEVERDKERLLWCHGYVLLVASESRDRHSTAVIQTWQQRLWTRSNKQDGGEGWLNITERNSYSAVRNGPTENKQAEFDVDVNEIILLYWLTPTREVGY